MTFIDIAVSAVPTANKERYIKEASIAASIFRRNGALQVTENWGVEVPEGKVTDFHRAVARKEDETIVVSTILWPSKDARDHAWPEVMKDPGMQGHEGLFDMSRMIFGSFEPIVTDG